MKRFFLIALFTGLHTLLFGQTFSPGKMTNVSSTIENKLVELAIQNPQLEIADHQINIAKDQLKVAKGWMLNNISVSFNANEFTVKRLQGKTPATGEYYPINPLYNIGVSIPLGGIFTKPAETRAAKEQVAIAMASRNYKFNEIKAAVLSAYQDYMTNQELLTVQSQITESTYSEFLQAKEKFRNGQITVIDYNLATQQYHDQLISRINAEHNFNLTKIQLENLIGVPLSSVLTNDGQPITNAPSDSTSATQ